MTSYIIFGAVCVGVFYFRKSIWSFVSSKVKAWWNDQDVSGPSA